MSHQLRKDPVTGRWVIVDQDSPRTEFAASGNTKSSRVCPFCPGNESMTPPAIATLPRRGSSRSEWQVRVIPNKFPALRIEETLEKSASGLYDRVGGYGAHEVIIEHPDHHREMADMDTQEILEILKVYRDRCMDLQKDPKLKYILIFKNYGRDAGASMEHPHSQLIALPIVPSRVQSEIKGGEKHMEFSDRCLFCDMIRQEESAKSGRLVLEDRGIVALEPFASRFPFETWILPKRHEAIFDRASEETLAGLAQALKTVLGKIKTSLGDPAYNFMIHTLPIGGKQTESFHWHIEIIPHLTRIAGFELGTGFYLNPTPPEAAAKKLRETL